MLIREHNEQYHTDKRPSETLPLVCSTRRLVVRGWHVPHHRRDRWRRLRRQGPPLTGLARACTRKPCQWWALASEASPAIAAVMGHMPTAYDKAPSGADQRQRF